MSRPDVRQPNLVVLSSKVWAAELASELTRLGHSEAEAERTAKTMLARVLGRARWPEQAFVVDDQAPLEEARP